MYACLYLKAADRMECTIELSPHVVPRSKRRFLRLVWQRYKPSQKETLQQKCFSKCNNTCLYTYVPPPPSRPHLTPLSADVRSSSPFLSLSFCSPDEFPVRLSVPPRSRDFPRGVPFIFVAAHATIASRASRVVFRIDRGKQSGGRAILSCSGMWIAERTDLGFPYKRIGYDSSMSGFPTGVEGRLRPHRLYRVAGYQHPPSFRDFNRPRDFVPVQGNDGQTRPSRSRFFFYPPLSHGGNYEIGAARMGKFRFNREDSRRRRLKSHLTFRQSTLSVRAFSDFTVANGITPKDR